MRDIGVTGVQTCALPICAQRRPRPARRSVVGGGDPGRRGPARRLRLAPSGGSPRAGERSGRVLLPHRTGGADSTQDRKPVTVEVSMASSWGPAAVAQERTTTSSGRETSSAPARRRPCTRNSARHSRCSGRTESDSARYQSSESPPYQATPTDQRGEPVGRSHMVTAPSPVSRKRRRSRKDRKSTRLNSSHANISYAVFCLKKKKKTHIYNLLYIFSKPWCSRVF